MTIKTLKSRLINLHSKNIHVTYEKIKMTTCPLYHSNYTVV